jgi:hypothetical protein
MLLELARVLASRPRTFTYELLWLDGEEAFCTDWTECGTAAEPDNTYGSRHYVSAAREAGALGALRALLLVDMVADRRLEIRRDTNSTPWLVDLVWATARRLGHDDVFVDQLTAVEDDHLPFLRAGLPAVENHRLPIVDRRGTKQLFDNGKQYAETAVSQISNDPTGVQWQAQMCFQIHMYHLRSRATW